MNPAHYIRWRLDMLRHWPTIQRLLPANGKAVEIGTWKGASAIRWLNQKPGYLGLVDPYVKPQDDSWEGRVSDIEKIRNQARYRVAKRDIDGVVQWVRKRSTVAVDDFKSETLDLVYIDGDHSYNAVIDDMVLWWAKLRVGGYMVLDDHIPNRWWGNDVLKAASEFKPTDEERRATFGRWLVIRKGDF